MAANHINNIATHFLVYLTYFNGTQKVDYISHLRTSNISTNGKQFSVLGDQKLEKLRLTVVGHEAWL